MVGRPGPVLKSKGRIFIDFVLGPSAVIFAVALWHWRHGIGMMALASWHCSRPVEAHHGNGRLQTQGPPLPAEAAPCISATVFTEDTQTLSLKRFEHFRF